MTRINTVPVGELMDQHLMAEYRELPMVMAAAKRSNTFDSTTVYTLNKGHVRFFYNKKRYLWDRWNDLIAELTKRGFKIDPWSRTVHWDELDKFPQTDWRPDEYAVRVNRQRIKAKIAQKPEWYRYYGEVNES